MPDRSRSGGAGAAKTIVSFHLFRAASKPQRARARVLVALLVTLGHRARVFRPASAWLGVIYVLSGRTFYSLR